MGNEPVPHLHHGSISDGLWKRRPPNVHLKGWSFTCEHCGTVCIAQSDDTISNIHEVRGEVAKSDITLLVPARCALCAKEKYAWQTRRDLLKKLPNRAIGYRPSLHTYTLGTAEVVNDDARADDRYYELFHEMKHAFRRFIRSKWWRNRVDGAFYTIEVKKTLLPHGGTKLHPHVHAIVLHQKPHDFQKAAEERGLGSYTYVRRVRVKTPQTPSKTAPTSIPIEPRVLGLEKPINYILKYALKGYGDPMYGGRYYETTGAFRKRKE